MTEMVKQCQRLTELGCELVTLISTDPNSLTANECGTRASLIEEKHKKLATAINELAVQPVVTTVWAETYMNLFNAEARFQKRYDEWREGSAAERECQVRALEYREQLQRGRVQHERRLRGEMV